MLNTKPPCRPTFRECLIVFILGSALVILSGCGPEKVANADLPRQVYDEVPLYDGPVNSVGTLTQAYIQNTEGLLLTNSRLKTLCVANKVCTQPQ